MISPKRLYENEFEHVLELLVKFYNSRPDSYGLLERSQEVYEEYAKSIQAYVKPIDSIVLDIGSGTWRIPSTIAKYGYKKVVGLDYFSEEKLIEYRAKLDAPNVELHSYETSKIPFDDNSFDVVTSLCVLEHIVYVEDFLNEIHRVLKPGGICIIKCPNWSGVNPAITALISTIVKKKRSWLYNDSMDSLCGIFRSIGWYFEVLFSSNDKFIMIYPRFKNNHIDFEISDDDVTHLCQPLSFKKYFKKRNYQILEYNRKSGNTLYSRIFNKIFPSLGTTNSIVVKKNKL